MPPTLYDIAQRAQVSVATVSRVLNGTATTVPISEATRERVRTVARELHYRPNLMARSLVQGSTRMLGLVLPKTAEALRSNYHAIIVAGISSVLSAYGYGLAVYFSDYGHGREGPNHAALLQDGRVDGGLVVDSFALSDDQIADLEREALRFPFVLVGHRLPKSTLNWVAADDRGGALVAVDHLLQLGHRRIAHVFNARGHPSRERSLGYQDALAAHQASIRPEWLVPAEEITDLGRLWSSDEPPTAVFAWNDYCALAVLRTLHQAGLRVPEDVSVVGYDDFELAALALPALTTVRVPLFHLGQVATEVLLGLLEGAPTGADGEGQAGDGPVQRVLPTSLVVRESSAAAASVTNLVRESADQSGGGVI